MDDTYLQDATSAAFGQIIGHQIFYLTRVEGVEIQDAVEFAERSPDPDVREIFTDVYAPY